MSNSLSDAKYHAVENDMDLELNNDNTRVESFFRRTRVLAVAFVFRVAYIPCCSVALSLLKFDLDSNVWNMGNIGWWLILYSILAGIIFVFEGLALCDVQNEPERGSWMVVSYLGLSAMVIWNVPSTREIEEATAIQYVRVMYGISIVLFWFQFLYAIANIVVFFNGKRGIEGHNKIIKRIFWWCNCQR